MTFAPLRPARCGLVPLALSAVMAAAGAQRADHSAFDALLKANVVNGMVDYDAFRAASSFPKYLALLAATDASTLPRDEQLAFWINACPLCNRLRCHGVSSAP